MMDMSVSTLEQSDRAYTILQSRRQYRCCHIQAPGEPHHQAAIEISGNYYSLLTVVRERDRTVRLCNRLCATGKTVVVTPTTKGDVVWTLEPDAVPVSRTAKRFAMSKSAATPVMPTQHYPICQIWLPGSNLRLAALAIEGKHYGIAQISTTLQQAHHWAADFSQEPEDVIITSLNAGFAVWLHEPVAQPCLPQPAEVCGLEA
jgi:hypothetical protein